MQLIKHKKIYLIISLVVLIPGLTSLFVFGLNLSVDFTGGSVFNYTFDTSVRESKEEIISIFEGNSVQVGEFVYEEDSKIILRTKPVTASTNSELLTALKGEYPSIEQLSFETVGPVIGKETTKNAFLSLIAVSVAIVLYISYAFRNIPKPYSSSRFGLSALIAMVHDAVLVLGIFSLLGHFYDIEIDSLFITAILTVIGFSIHDTIVVFDRIRENLSKLSKNTPFSEIVNYSVVETLNRSLATSLTVVITLLSLYLLGGSSIKYFVLALLIGVVSGTYSSIFTASPLLVVWEDYLHRKVAVRPVVNKKS